MRIRFKVTIELGRNNLRGSGSNCYLDLIFRQRTWLQIIRLDRTVKFVLLQLICLFAIISTTMGEL